MQILWTLNCFFMLYTWPTKQVFFLYLRRILDNESFWKPLKSTCPNPKEQQLFFGTSSLKVDVKCSNIAVNQGGCFVSKRTKVKNKRRWPWQVLLNDTWSNHQSVVFSFLVGISTRTWKPLQKIQIFPLKANSKHSQLLYLTYRSRVLQACLPPSKHQMIHFH